MTKPAGAVHVTTQRRHYMGKDGRERVYQTHLLRRSWRENGKVRNETVANLPRLPAETIGLVRRSLAGERFIPGRHGGQSGPVAADGHAAAVAAMGRKLGFPALLGPPCRQPLRAGRVRALPGRQARQGPDRVRPADRQGRPPGDGAGVRRQHPGPEDLPRGGRRGARHVRAQADDHGPDRGVITSARIRDLRKLEGMAWITCLRGPAIRKLMADGGPLQLSLSGEQDLAQITSSDFPGERLICCRNPVLAAERAPKRADLLAATEADLAKIAARAAAGRARDPDKIGLAARKVISKRKAARHFILDIGEGRLS
jgi:hypothetical protein